ncbi:MAG: hypothetical protein M1376_02025 [Planctomycetes bacterium]|nr:hypothetical protein [Planctomycetota bacterium]
MKRRDTFILVGVILAAGTAAFCVGRTAALRQKTDAAGPPARWPASGQAVQTEQRFEQQTGQLIDEVRAKQAQLTSMLPDARFTGAQILGQVEDIAQSYARLARSVGGHVALLCSTLPQAQRQQVMQSCANSLRGGMQRRYRWRGGAQDQGQGFRGGRRGGWGPGGGRGSGYGRGTPNAMNRVWEPKQFRGGRNEGSQDLAGRLRLTQEQSTWIEQQDPNFQEQCTVLRDRLYEAHTNLAASLEGAQSTEPELTAKVDALIDAHNALEKRVAQYIVLLRPQLTRPQLDQLCELCRGGARITGIPVRTGPDLLGDIMAAALSFPVLAGSL